MFEVFLMEREFIKVFKALGENTRMKIIKLLSYKSMCVCELSEVLGMLQPRISQHLKILKEARLVNESKEGYWVFYSLNEENLIKYWKDFSAFIESDLNDLEEFPGIKNKIDNLSCRTK
jgi:ArsR family transcriptional regulator